MSHPIPYKWIPKNRDKYIGDLSDIWVRSSWEKKAMVFFDATPSILKWSSEELVIPYISPVDGKPHRYFVDFVVEYMTKQGERKKALVEVKPKMQCKPPVKKSKVTKRYIQETVTYMTNEAKWAAAKDWCSKRGYVWMILTEDDLGV